jgi:hypothetical protein
VLKRGVDPILAMPGTLKADGDARVLVTPRGLAVGLFARGAGAVAPRPQDTRPVRQTRRNPFE